MDSNTTDHIDHQAVVTSTDPAKGLVMVSLVDGGACGGCAAASICGQAMTSDSKPASISVWCRDAGAYSIGQHVTLRGTERMHRRAIMLATVLPCICLVAIMSIIYILTFDQLAAALGGLASMVLFFAALYLCRNRIAHEFTFSIVESPDKDHTL